MRRTRGSNAVEFALIAPVFIALMGGIMDYGWFFTTQHTLITSVREGTRAGAATDQDSDPEAVAETRVREAMDNAGLDGTGAEVSATLSGVSPDQVLTVSVASDYSALMGLVPVPSTLQATLTMRVENQPD